MCKCCIHHFCTGVLLSWFAALVSDPLNFPAVMPSREIDQSPDAMNLQTPKIESFLKIF